MSAALAAIGFVMMGSGVVLFVYVSMLDLAHVRQARWYERETLVAASALSLLLLGGLLAFG